MNRIEDEDENDDEGDSGNRRGRFLEKIGLSWPKANGTVARDAHVAGTAIGVIIAGTETRAPKIISTPGTASSRGSCLCKSDEVAEERSAFKSKVTLGIDPKSTRLDDSELLKREYILKMELAAINKNARVAAGSVRTQRSSQSEIRHYEPGARSALPTPRTANVIVPIRSIRNLHAIHRLQGVELLVIQSDSIEKDQTTNRRSCALNGRRMKDWWRSLGDKWRRRSLVRILAVCHGGSQVRFAGIRGKINRNPPGFNHVPASK